MSRSIANFLASIAPTKVDKTVHSYDTKFDGVPVRVYDPVKKEKRGRAVVYFHGGGFVIGDLGW